MSVSGGESDRVRGAGERKDRRTRADGREALRRKSSSSSCGERSCEGCEEGARKGRGGERGGGKARTARGEGWSVLRELRLFINESSSLVADGRDLEPEGSDVWERRGVAAPMAGGRGAVGRWKGGLRVAEDLEADGGGGLGADGELGSVGVLPLRALFA